jgi:hypothetical protein
MSDGGKGSSPRPFSVSKEEFDNSWENIFKKKDKRNEDGEKLMGKPFNENKYDSGDEYLKD